MLPDGLSADLLSTRDQAPFKARHPDAQTVVRLLRGACSCDFVVARQPVTREDEAWLRRRFRELGVPRERVIAALETHRRALERPRRATDRWPDALAGFVAEHVRNAGRSLYLLRFSHPGPSDAPLPRAERTVSPAEVRATPSGWLAEDILTWVE